MASIIASFLSGIIGTGLEISVFMILYAYFKGVPIDWTFVVVFVIVWTLIFGPISYYVTSQKEKEYLKLLE